MKYYLITWFDPVTKRSFGGLYKKEPRNKYLLWRNGVGQWSGTSWTIDKINGDTYRREKFVFKELTYDEYVLECI